jgi:hypothetical protein
MKINIVSAILCVVCFMLGGIGLHYNIPYSGWAIFIAVVAGLNVA